eukprot:m.445356 g.445356  ORF g.445356 m.445356 type:complete len:959 (+) comp20302_c1_seq1:294-3170(+)
MASPLAPLDVARFSKVSRHIIKPEQLPEDCRGRRNNRYYDILPNPATIVKLQNGDYFNANYVRGIGGKKREYIAASAPMPHQVETFLRLIWEQKCVVVIMLTGLVEKGTTKCEPYWEQDQGEVFHAGEFQVKTLHVETLGAYVRTLLRFQRGSEHRDIMHFWYNTWPDHGVPTEPDGAFKTKAAAQMLTQARKQQKAMDNGRGPLFVHCSAGIGRTGCFIIFDLALQALKAGHKVNLNIMVDKLRQDRMALVQHPQQYEWLHQCVADWLRDNKGSIPRPTEQRKPPPPPSSAASRSAAPLPTAAPLSPTPTQQQQVEEDEEPDSSDDEQETQAAGDEELSFDALMDKLCGIERQPTDELGSDDDGGDASDSSSSASPTPEAPNERSPDPAASNPSPSFLTSAPKDQEVNPFKGQGGGAPDKPPRNGTALGDPFKQQLNSVIGKPAMAPPGQGSRQAKALPSPPRSSASSPPPPPSSASKPVSTSKPPPPPPSASKPKAAMPPPQPRQAPPPMPKAAPPALPTASAGNSEEKNPFSGRSLDFAVPAASAAQATDNPFAKDKPAAVPPQQTPSPAAVPPTEQTWLSSLQPWTVVNEAGEVSLPCGKLSSWKVSRLPELDARRLVSPENIEWPAIVSHDQTWRHLLRPSQPAQKRASSKPVTFNEEAPAEHATAEFDAADLILRTAELDAKSGELDAAQAELARREAELDQREADISKKQRQVEVDDVRRQADNAELQAQRLDVQEQLSELAARESALQARTTGLDEREQALKQRAEEIESRERGAKQAAAKLDADREQLELEKSWQSAENDLMSAQLTLAAMTSANTGGSDSDGDDNDGDDGGDGDGDGDGDSSPAKQEARPSAAAAKPKAPPKKPTLSKPKTRTPPSKKRSPKGSPRVSRPGTGSPRTSRTSARPKPGTTSKPKPTAKPTAKTTKPKPAPATAKPAIHVEDPAANESET